AGESLRAQRSGSVCWEVHDRRSVINRYRPVVAGDGPGELVVIFEVAPAVAHGVIDLDHASGVHGVRNENLQIAEAARDVRFVFQRIAGAVGDAGDVEKQRVVGAARAGILHRNEAMDAMPFGNEDQRDALVYRGGASAAEGERGAAVRKTAALARTWEAM